MNPNVSGGGLRCQDAVGVLEDRLRDPHHRFWSDDIGLPEGVAPFRDRLLGHRQITDAYLLGLAIHHGGKLATLDRGLLSLLPVDSPARRHIELIPEALPAPGSLD
jgi:predicted nucleic acid-binding protein